MQSQTPGGFDSSREWPSVFFWPRVLFFGVSDKVLYDADIDDCLLNGTCQGFSCFLCFGFFKKIHVFFYEKEHKKLEKSVTIAKLSGKSREPTQIAL